MESLLDTPIAHPFTEVFDVSDADARLTRLESQVSQTNVEVAKLVQTIDGYRGNQEQLLAMMQRMLNRHDEQLNGYQDKPGLVTHLDRIIQRENGRTWHIRALWTAVIAVVVRWITGKFGGTP